MLLTLQSILASARQPPLHFQKLAESHYRQTRERLLARCRVKLAEAQAQAQETVGGKGVHGQWRVRWEEWIAMDVRD